MELGSKIADYAREHLSIWLVDLLVARFIFGIPVENFSVGNVPVSLLQERAQVAEDAGFPIDQRSVAIERDVFDLRKIRHDCELRLLLRLGSHGCRLVQSELLLQRI